MVQGYKMNGVRVRKVSPMTKCTRRGQDYGGVKTMGTTVVIIMTPTTRSTGIDAELEHLVTVVLKLSVEPTLTSLKENEIDTLEIFQTLEESGMDKLMYKVRIDDVNTKELPLNVLTVLRLKQALRYLDWVANEQDTNDVSSETCFLLTHSEFLAFVKSSRSPPAINNIITTTETSPTPDPLKDWKRGIKRDIENYPVFKEERYWLDWRKQMTTTATMHGIANLVKSDYTEPNESHDLFTEHNH